ncbi:MAG: hypoxanthine phosphoribosyltransferase [Ruminococcus sp.]|nr:hypoxanthine phosphoribosyltransferase [Ruminococcus sp.]
MGYDMGVKRVLFSSEEIHDRVRRAGEMISREYQGKPLLLIGILNGSFMFMADLCREITIPFEVAFMKAKSYSGTQSAGSVEISLDVAQDLSRYHVILVEDIIDTGRTLKALSERLSERGALSLKVITLLDKPERRLVDFNADISLFTIPDLFVVGYGLDLDERYRGLPYVAEYGGA